VTPPKSQDEWASFIEAFSRHEIAIRGLKEVRQWYFEVWNEPNIAAFWTGGQAAYFQLYETTVNAIKGVDKRLRVGGPATADNGWIDEFLAFCAERKLPADFVSTHLYPTDAFGQIGADTETQLEHAPPDLMHQKALEARRKAAGKPLLYTEWNITSNPRDPLHDSSFAAALAVRIALSVDALVDAYSFWTFSDIFEENYFPSVPFHGGFGLLNLHGIGKPVYQAFRLLAMLGDRHYPIAQTDGNVVLWAGEEGAQAPTTQILCINQAMPRHVIDTESVSLTVRAHPGFRAGALTVRRIDDEHANPARLWRQMGQPDYLSAGQVDALRRESEPLAEPLAFELGADGLLRLSFQAAPQSVNLLQIEWTPTT